MLNSLLDSIGSADHDLDPQALADKLGLSLRDLAALVNVSRNTLSAKPASPRLEAALRPLIKILALATEATGSENRALLWFKFNPIASLGTKSPIEHVRDGHADWVLAHIEDVLNGVYA